MSAHAQPLMVERSGWRFFVPAGARDHATAICDELLGQALTAVDGARGRPHRRSRHATTYRIRPTSSGAITGEVFLKILDAPVGLDRLKRMVRGSRTRHVAAITARLNAFGFSAPAVLMYGCERAGGREVIAIRRADGDGPFATMMAIESAPLMHKRAILRAVGREVARLHRCGFVHGDLTPHNILAVRDEPPRFIFIDHERTRRAFPFGRRHRQLRNLVQLGRFNLPGLTCRDRLRVLDAYAAASGVRNRGAFERRVARMLARRLKRDGAGVRCATANPRNIAR
ncbi:MAG: lipopolysaccharide kinase InaA family protein [Candidatus Binataceae bacterium]